MKNADGPPQNLTIGETPREELVEDAIYAVYDLGISPVTYDVLQFLGSCEAFRRSKKKKWTYVCFVMGPRLSFRKHTFKDHALSDDQKLWRVSQILEPCAKLLRNCLGVSKFNSRLDAARFLRDVPPSQIFPRGYSVERPKAGFMTHEAVRYWEHGHDVRWIEPSAAASDYVRAWISGFAPGKPIVSMTVRQSEIEQHRDSRLEEWMTFTDHVRAHDMVPVGIPDTDFILNHGSQNLPDQVDWFVPGALNPDLRAAFYKQCRLNMSYGGGPAFINVYMPGSSYLIFMGERSTLKGAPTNEDFGRQMGFAWGSQFPWATETQRLAWDLDSFENLKHRFDEIAPKI